MKKLVIFYSYTGKAKKKAKVIANNEGSDLLEVKDANRPNVLKAYTIGCLAAMRKKEWPILPLEKDMDDYDELTIVSPVWAGQPVPAIWTLMRQLPIGKNVRVVMVSASGKSKSEETVVPLMKKMACRLIGYEDCKG